MRLLAFALAAACLYLILRPSEQDAADTADAQASGAFGTDGQADTSILENVLNTASSAVRSTFGGWRPPAKYATAIQQAEDANGIPRDVLARLLYQECHWREDIITGRTTSPVGAVGIAQFMPATAAERGLNPLDPLASIAEAGKYLAWLYRRHGNWTEALAAYNWGTGNVARKGLAQAPAETRNYYAQILGDVNAANGTAWA